jgi:hypothetical protein
MRSQKSKEELIEKVIEQIKEDVHCGDYTALEIMLKFLSVGSVENLIAYLPAEDWKPFSHLVAKQYLNEEEDPEVRTENALSNLIKTYPNDIDLGKEIRKRYGRFA